MNKYILTLAGVAALALFSSTEALARGPAGGGARGAGGGGAARAGGGAAARPGGGAAARPAGGAFNASPSMSRAVPAQRPAQGGQGLAAQRPAQAGQGVAAQRPAQAGQGIAAQRPAATPANRPAADNFQRPTQNQLGSFLNLPQQGAQAGARGATPAPPRPSQLPSGGQGAQSKSVTTPGGSTITVAGGRGSATTPGGATISGAGAGVKIEGAGGNTYVKGAGAVGGTKGRNTAVAGGSITAARNQYGYTAVNARGASSVGGVGRVGSVTAVRGPGGNVIATGRGASFVNGQFVSGRSWTAVNGAYTRWGCFTPGWYGRYPGCWWPGKWAIATTAWATLGWATCGGYCGCSGDACYYDYGGNVIYEDGNVYYGDQPVATAEQYYDEAVQLADSGQQTQDEEWLPLGVFAVIAEPAQTQTDKVVQLAINKDGEIRGNFQDNLTDKVVPVIGAVDKKTQRVAIRPEGNTSIVVETGLYNLTNDEVPVLVHFGPDRQELRTLIRLKPPEEQPAAQ